MDFGLELVGVLFASVIYCMHKIYQAKWTSVRDIYREIYEVRNSIRLI